jgi:predicted cupin superfamily sugar epimerase
MHPRAKKLIDLLELEPHPEGGMFVQTFRSKAVVAPADARGARAALTVIYFLLVEDARSRWHRVGSDEAWHWYEGAALELLSAPGEGGVAATMMLGPLGGVSRPQHVVAAGCWQAARSTGAYTLVGCSVGPGFEFDDFTLLASLAESDRPRLSPESVFQEFL